MLVTLQYPALNFFSDADKNSWRSQLTATWSAKLDELNCPHPTPPPFVKSFSFIYSSRNYTETVNANFQLVTMVCCSMSTSVFRLMSSASKFAFICMASSDCVSTYLLAWSLMLGNCTNIVVRILYMFSFCTVLICRRKSLCVSVVWYN